MRDHLHVHDEGARRARLAGRVQVERNRVRLVARGLGQAQLKVAVQRDGQVRVLHPRAQLQAAPRVERVDAVRGLRADRELAGGCLVLGQWRLDVHLAQVVEQVAVDVLAAAARGQRRALRELYLERARQVRDDQERRDQRELARLPRGDRAARL